MDSAYPALDADVAFPTRKPQLTSLFDPRWAVSFYHGLGAGPYGLAPYVSRGVVPPMGYVGSGKLQPTRRGWAYKGSADGSSDAYGVVGSAITWTASQVGTFIYVFEAATDSGTGAPGGYVHAVVGDLSGTAGVASVVASVEAINSGDPSDPASVLEIGWNGTFSTVGLSGLWKAGDLVVVALSYDGSTQTVYVQGASKGADPYSTAGSPVGSSTNTVSLGGDNSGSLGAGTSTGKPILYGLFSDRPFSAAEMAWIARNPLNWMFMPGPITAAFGLGVTSYVLTFADAESPTDALTIATAPAMFTDTLAALDALQAGLLFTQAVADSATAADASPIFTTGPAISDGAAPADAVVFATTHQFSDSIAPTDLVLSGFLYTRAFSDTQTPADATPTIAFASVKSDTAAAADDITFATAHVLADSVPATDATAFSMGWSRSFAEQLVASDALTWQLTVLNFHWKPVGQITPDLRTLVTYTMVQASAVSVQATPQARLTQPETPLVDRAVATDTVSIVMS